MFTGAITAIGGVVGGAVGQAAGAALAPVAGAIGGVVGGIGGAVSALNSGGGFFGAVAGAINGATTGAAVGVAVVTTVCGFTGVAVGSGIVGVYASAVNDIRQQWHNHKTVDWKRVGTTALKAGIFGFLSGNASDDGSMLWAGLELLVDIVGGSEDSSSTTSNISSASVQYQPQAKAKSGWEGTNSTNLTSPPTNTTSKNWIGKASRIIGHPA